MWVIGRFLLGCDHGLFLGYLPSAEQIRLSYDDERLKRLADSCPG
jgi:hypothetical protein